MQIIVSKYLKQKLLEMKGQMDKFIILVGDFNSNRQSEKKIGKDIEHLTIIIDQLDLFFI